MEKGDLLSILLTDDLFKHDDTLIIDECITFFFAAAQTSSMATQNMFFFLIQQPELMKKARSEIKNVIIDPYIRDHP